MRYQLERFEEEKARFKRAWDRGERREAREHLLLAAKFLYLVAEKAEAEKAAELAERAARLTELARSIDEQTSKLKEDGGEARAEEAPGRRWKLERKPGTRFDDVAGLLEAKNYLSNRVINPMKFPEVSLKFKKRPGGGLLLYGPPGTGKTMLGRAIATEIEASFFSARCSDIISKWVGDSERNVKELFETARAESPSVIFLDEIEALVPRRGGQSTVMNRVVPEMLSQMDGIEVRDGCLLIIGATNRPWDLDEAMLRPGRFDEKVYVGLPDAQARRLILERELRGVPFNAELDLAALAGRLEGYSGADIKGISQAATDFPFRREIDSGQPQTLTAADMQKAMSRRRPSVTTKQLTKFAAFTGQ